MMHIIEGLAGDWRQLDERIEGSSTDIKELADQDPACEFLEDATLPLRTSPRSPFERSIVPSSNSEFPSFAVQMRTQRIIVPISLRLVEERARI
jgi:hypothetical protein